VPGLLSNEEWKNVKDSTFSAVISIMPISSGSKCLISESMIIPIFKEGLEDKVKSTPSNFRDTRSGRSLEMINDKSTTKILLSDLIDLDILPKFTYILGDSFIESTIKLTTNKNTQTVPLQQIELTCNTSGFNQNFGTPSVAHTITRTLNVDRSSSTSHTYGSNIELTIAGKLKIGGSSNWTSTGTNSTSSGYQSQFSTTIPSSNILLPAGYCFKGAVELKSEKYASFINSNIIAKPTSSNFDFIMNANLCEEFNCARANPVSINGSSVDVLESIMKDYVDGVSFNNNDKTISLDSKTNLEYDIWKSRLYLEFYKFNEETKKYDIIGTEYRDSDIPENEPTTFVAPTKLNEHKINGAMRPFWQYIPVGE
jgi:hypothetical protein